MALTANKFIIPNGAPSAGKQAMQSAAAGPANFQTQKGLSDLRTDKFDYIDSTDLLGTGGVLGTAYTLSKEISYIAPQSSNATDYSLALPASSGYNIGDEFLILSDDADFTCLIWLQAGDSAVDSVQYFKGANPQLLTKNFSTYIICPKIGSVLIRKVAANTWAAIHHDYTYERKQVWSSFYQVAHGFSRYDVIRKSASGANWEKAIANDYDSCAQVAIVLGSPTINGADNFYLLDSGLMQGESGDSPFTAGALYYLSDSTAGLLTTTRPTATGSFEKPILRAINARSGYFSDLAPRPVQKDRLHILHSITGLTGGGATNLDGLTSADWDDDAIVTLYLTGTGKTEWQKKSGNVTEDGITLITADDGPTTDYWQRVA